MRRFRFFVVAMAVCATLAATADSIALGPSSSAIAPDLPAVDDGTCDPIDPAHCLLPFPNDFFTVDDPSTDTARRVAISPLAMPRNRAGKPIDPTEWNRNDGFSPGSMILSYVPGLDLDRTWDLGGADHITDPATSNDADAPIFIVDAATGRRHPFWSELDTHPQTTDDRRLLILRPTVNFEEGHRYIVAMRHLKDAAGNEIAANDAFAAYRDGEAAPGAVPSPLFEARRPAMERIFAELDAAEPSAHYDRGGLYLAWDFTVASARSLAGRVLHIRDDAFGELGDHDLADRRIEGDAPAYEIGAVTDFDTGATARRVEGTVAVPNYLTHEVKIDQGDGYSAVAAPGARFFYASPLDDNPSQNPLLPTIDVPFVCNLPRTASASDPAHPMLYGHGLLGARQEANGGSTEDLRLRNFMPCAVDWMGMSFSDLANVATILLDMSNFPSLADRSQQGFLNFLYLGRAMAHPTQGFATRTEFRAADGSARVRSDELYYDGNSQGGIMGGALTALAPDFTTSVLGVPAMNYSTLLNRSSDWEGGFDAAGAAQEAVEEQDAEELMPPYSYPTYQSYPDKLEQQLVFALVQMVWDRAESNGFAHHMTDDPYPNTPAHHVMLQVAFSDHQVANVAAEVEGRTIGATLHGGSDPTTGEWAPVPFGLHWARDPEFGFDRAPFGVPGGSYLVYWHSTDRGLTTPPNGNVPPRVGEDPHEAPRRNNRGSDQKAHFLLTTALLDVCGGPCVTDAAAERN